MKRKKLLMKLFAFLVIFAIAFGAIYKEGIINIKANEKSNDIVIGEISEDELESTDIELMEDGSVKTVVVRKDGIKVISISNETCIIVTVYDKNGIRL